MATCQRVNVSTCQRVKVSKCQRVNVSKCQCVNERVKVSSGKGRGGLGNVRKEGGEGGGKGVANKGPSVGPKACLKVLPLANTPQPFACVAVVQESNICKWHVTLLSFVAASSCAMPYLQQSLTAMRARACTSANACMRRRGGRCAIKILQYLVIIYFKLVPP
jgi:hypothetical protein